MVEPPGGPQGFSRYEVQLEEIPKRTLASTSEEISYEWTDFESRRRYEVRLKTVESNQNGHLQEARYNVDGLRKRKLDKNGNSSKEFATGISTSASRPGNSSSSAPTISYISGHMILGAEIDDGTGSEFVFHLPDALGSTRDVVDSSGNVIRSFEHDEYGNLISSWSSGTGAATSKTWIGGLSVNDDTADSGLWNMGHRNYAGGVLGRFISRDPIGFNGSPMNLYAYPTNPVNAVDPSGLEPRELGVIDRALFDQAIEILKIRPNGTSEFNLSRYQRAANRLQKRLNSTILIDSSFCNSRGADAATVKANRFLGTETVTYLNGALFLAPMAKVAYGPITDDDLLVQKPFDLTNDEAMYLAAVTLAEVLYHEDCHASANANEADAYRGGLTFLLALLSQERDPRKQQLIRSVGSYRQGARDKVVEGEPNYFK